MSSHLKAFNEFFTLEGSKEAFVLFIRVLKIFIRTAFSNFDNNMKCLEAAKEAENQSA